MRSPESSLDMRKSELSPKVKSYIENLTAQINEVPRELGLKSLQDMLDALDQDNVAFEQDAVRRNQIVDAAEQLSKLIEMRRRVKETGEIPEKNDHDEPFDPENWNPEDFPTAEKFLRDNLDKIKEGKRVEAQRIGGKTKVELTTDLQKAKMKTTAWSSFLLNSENFTTLEAPEEIITIRLTVADLGFTKDATTAEIYARAKELGLELCPAEVGPHYRLSHLDQPLNESIAVGMELITDQDGYPSVFSVRRHPDGLFLGTDSAGPEFRWNPQFRFLFRLRKKNAS